jgi:hypothetical protein
VKVSHKKRRILDSGSQDSDSDLRSRHKKRRTWRSGSDEEKKKKRGKHRSHHEDKGHKRRGESRPKKHRKSRDRGVKRHSKEEEEGGEEEGDKKLGGSETCHRKVRAKSLTAEDDEVEATVELVPRHNKSKKNQHQLHQSLLTVMMTTPRAFQKSPIWMMERWKRRRKVMKTMI